MRTIADVARRADVRIWPDKGGIANAGLIDDAAVANQSVVADLAVAEHRIGPNPTFAPDSSFAEQLYERLDDCVGADRNFGVDNAGLWSEDRDAVCHEFSRFSQPQRCIQ